MHNLGEKFWSYYLWKWSNKWRSITSLLLNQEFVIYKTPLPP